MLLEISSLKWCCGICVSIVINITSITYTDLATMISKLDCFSHGTSGSNPLPHIPHALTNTTAPHWVSVCVQPGRSVILSNSLCPHSSSPAITPNMQVGCQTYNSHIKSQTHIRGALQVSVLGCNHQRCYRPYSCSGQAAGICNCWRAQVALECMKDNTGEAHLQVTDTSATASVTKHP